jgi:hypothetical protein
MVEQGEKITTLILYDLCEFVVISLFSGSSSLFIVLGEFQATERKFWEVPA